jgi:hypothetical protein
MPLLAQQSKGTPLARDYVPRRAAMAVLRPIKTPTTKKCSEVDIGLFLVQLSKSRRRAARTSLASFADPPCL